MCVCVCVCMYNGYLQISSAYPKCSYIISNILRNTDVLDNNHLL